MKIILKRTLPPSVWKMLQMLNDAVTRALQNLLGAVGYNVSRRADFYAPLPTQSDLEKNVSRWNRPSAMTGVCYNLESFKTRLSELMDKHWESFCSLPTYNENKEAGFGPGYPELDALVLYMMVRELKPARYLEIGCGLSTYYCTLAAQQNAEDGKPLSIKCVEPDPYNKLYTLDSVEIIKSKAQDVARDVFLELWENDILFIDSSHVVNIGGEVPYLFLEILPALRKGVIIHIHDVPFPFNTPYPADYWILGKTWPVYWNEAMLLQAFLTFNRDYEIIMSTPLIRYHDEAFLVEKVPVYRPVCEQPNTFSSIWIKKIA